MDPMVHAQRTFEALIEGAAGVEEAEAALAEIDDYRPKGMYDPDLEAQEEPVDRLYGEAANCYKLALDALRSSQQELARSYVRVASIKLEKARSETA